MSQYIIPIMLIFLFIFCIFKKINVYQSFVDGTKESLKVVLGIFPFIMAIFMCISLFKASGFSVILANILSPVFNFLKIPSELTELIIIRPLSGSGSIALLEEIINTYNADSYVTRVACVILGSSETILYVTAIYFSTVKVKKIGGAIVISLIASVVGIIFSCVLCRFL